MLGALQAAFRASLSVLGAPGKTLLVSSRTLATTQVQEWHKPSWRGNGYGHHGGPWLCLYNPNTGRRDPFPLAHQRFKRLDWGIYIRPRAGRAKKHWQKSAATLWRIEQHIFCAPFHNRRLDRMFAPEVKEPRFIPNDPYLKYNRLSFWKHISTKLKNHENITKHGNNTFRFNRWKAHLSKHGTKYNRLEKQLYEPPGYLENVASNNGVYCEEFIPSDTPAPHFQRAPIRMNRRMHDKWMDRVKMYELNYGRLEPWHPLLRGQYKKL